MEDIAAKYLKKKEKGEGNNEKSFWIFHKFSQSNINGGITAVFRSTNHSNDKRTHSTHIEYTINLLHSPKAQSYHNSNPFYW